MPELAIPMPPPTASVSAIAREVRRRRSRRRPALGVFAMRFVLVPPLARRALRQPRERGSLRVRTASGLPQAIEIPGDAMEPRQWEPRR